MSTSIGIVGAGITGLTCAFRLKQLGFDVHVYESASRPGGAIHSEEHEGFLLEYGPHTLLERTAGLAELIEDLGLGDMRTEASPAAKLRYIVRDGHPVALPSSPGQALTTGALSPAAKLRVLAEPFIAGSQGADGVEESLAEFITRRLGPEVLDYLVDSFVGGTYAGNPRLLSVKHSFPMLHDLEAAHGSIFSGMIARMRERRKNRTPRSPKPSHALVSFKGGLSTLIDRLATELEDELLLETTARKIHREANGWKIIYKKGRGHARRFHDTVILAIPADRVAKLDLRDAGGRFHDLSPLAAVPYAPVSLVHMGFRRRDIEHPCEGLGMLVPGVENFHILGTLFTSSMFPERAPAGHVSLATFIGGARHPALCNEDDDTLLEIARMDLHRLLGVRGAPVFKKLIRYPRAIPQYNVGHGHFLDLAEKIQRDHPGLYLTGNWKDGIAVPALVEAATRLANTVAGRHHGVN
ncbi:MAG: protoporphyrinogen oxidase [Bradymonadaceae bacterium]